MFPPVKCEEHVGVWTERESCKAASLLDSSWQLRQEKNVYICMYIFQAPPDIVNFLGCVPGSTFRPRPNPKQHPQATKATGRLDAWHHQGPLRGKFGCETVSQYSLEPTFLFIVANPFELPRGRWERKFFPDVWILAKMSRVTLVWGMITQELRV